MLLHIGSECWRLRVECPVLAGEICLSCGAHTQGIGTPRIYTQDLILVAERKRRAVLDFETPLDMYRRWATLC
jgi:hypothetical protein